MSKGVISILYEIYYFYIMLYLIFDNKRREGGRRGRIPTRRFPYPTFVSILEPLLFHAFLSNIV